MGFSVNAQRESRRSLEDRLTEKRRITEAGCWEWTKSVTGHGYGRMSYQNHVYRVHRLAAHLWLGLDISDPSVAVCHHCDNPPCFNPDHLYLGSQRTNVRDMHQRGRGYPGPQKWTHCANGHELTPETRVAGAGRCKICANRYNKERRARVDAVKAMTAALTSHQHPTPLGSSGKCDHEARGITWAEGDTTCYVCETCGHEWTERD